jgi:hypothetical protein
MTDDDSCFHAYEIPDQPDMLIRAAPVERDWMDASIQRFAYRCLPLTIANQAGWLIHNPVTFVAEWDGGPHAYNLRIGFPADENNGTDLVQPSVITVAAGVAGLDPAGPHGPDRRISSHFGSGVVTITLPYLFRTPPSINLWVKGPSNWIKDGAQALEGIVESDWSPATFTMNWKLTRPNCRVRFDCGEPICMVVPVWRGLAESLHPVRSSLSTRPDLQKQYEEWNQAREEFLRALRTRQPEAVRAGWQRDYTKGTMPGGATAPQHQTKLRLREFQRYQPPNDASSDLADESAARPTETIPETLP